MGAVIEVRNTISIVGRGTVVIGYLRTGEARAGQVTTSLRLGSAPERPLVVSVVQRLSSTEGEQALGLVFREPPSLREIQDALPPGTMLVLSDQET